MLIYGILYGYILSLWEVENIYIPPDIIFIHNEMKVLYPGKILICSYILSLREVGEM
jgi:hypothetical protein